MPGSSEATTAREYEDPVVVSKNENVTVFLCAENAPSTSDCLQDHEFPESTTRPTDTMFGCVRVDFDIPIRPENAEASTSYVLNGSFGMLSVPASSGRQGIGSLLIQAVENFLLGIARTTAASREPDENNGAACNYIKVYISMPLISVRPDLFPFYEKRGYARKAHDDAASACPEELRKLLSPEYDGKVSFIWYEKSLLDTEKS